MDRTYDPETKQWFISERFFEPTKKLAQAIWSNPGECIIIDRQTTEAQQTSSNAPMGQSSMPIDSICKRFMELLPPEAAKAAYRKAATMLHPDIDGGDANKMALLNSLWSRLEKELYTK